jgi:hypothetical protein
VICYFFSEEDIDIINESIDWRLKNVNIDLRVSPTETDRDILFKGLKAEMAFAKYFGLEFQRRIPKNGDGGIDFIIMGRTIQIKFSKIELFFRKKYGGMKTDIAVLIKPYTDNGVEFVGWTTKSIFEKLSVEKDYRNMNRPVRAFPSQHLMPIGTLVRTIINSKNKKE